MKRADFIPLGIAGARLPRSSARQRTTEPLSEFSATDWLANMYNRCRVCREQCASMEALKHESFSLRCRFEFDFGDVVGGRGGRAVAAQFAGVAVF